MLAIPFSPDGQSATVTVPTTAAVLVVDDQPDAREMLAEYLSFCGFTVQQAADGIEAIDAAVRVHPAVILMDLMMPRLDGWQATRRLKADERTKNIPVIAVSALADEQQRARQAGCDEFIPKPVDLESLVGFVRVVLSEHDGLGT